LAALDVFAACMYQVDVM